MCPINVAAISILQPLTIKKCRQSSCFFNGTGQAARKGVRTQKKLHKKVSQETECAKCTAEKKLLGTSASLLVTSALLVVTRIT